MSKRKYSPPAVRVIRPEDVDFAARLRGGTDRRNAKRAKRAETNRRNQEALKND